VRGGGGKLRTGFWRENLKQRDHLEKQGIYGRITLNGL
jgi:hypothetical protein